MLRRRVEGIRETNSSHNPNTLNSAVFMPSPPQSHPIIANLQIESREGREREDVLLNDPCGNESDVHPAVTGFWFVLNSLCAIFQRPSETRLHTYQLM